MAWRDQIRRPASFRGVPFSVTDAEARIGRRMVLHEYPQRDDPYPEDLGRRARVFVVEAHVVGEDYLTRRDALMRAIEQDGPGELIHPRHGVLKVVVLDHVSVKESSREGGIARFSITFVQAGDNQFPSAAADTVAQLDATSQAVDTAASEAFSRDFSVEGPGLLETTALGSFQKDLDASVRLARQVMSTADLAGWVANVSGVSGALASLLRTPAQLAQSLVSLQVQMVSAVYRPQQALAEFRTLFASNPRPSRGTGLTGSTRAALHGNEVARSDLQRRLIITSSARALAIAISTDSLTADQARQLRDRQLALMDQEAEANDPPAPVARALSTLRAAVVRDVQQRAEMLREASTFTPMAVLPSVVLAHRIYQDAGRADELVARNAIRHPGFVPATALEVLR